MDDAKVLTEKELVGAQLTQLLDARGWNASDLARALGGLSPQMVASWVRGDRMPSAKYAAWLPQVLGVDPTLFFGRPDSQVRGPTMSHDAADASTEKQDANGMDPLRTVQVMLAMDLLEGATKAADRLLNSNLLEPAEKTLWNGIRAAEKELLGHGMTDETPGQASGPPPNLGRRIPLGEDHSKASGDDAAS